jgi:putative hemolysin
VDPFTLAGLAILLLLLGLSAFFSMSETALIAVDRLDLRRRIAENDAMARRIDRMLQEPERILSTVLVGNNIVNISAASLATVLAVRLWPDNGAVIAAITLTFAVLIFGEITPKTLAVQHPYRLARLVAVPLGAIEVLLKPVVVVAAGLSKGLIRLTGVKAPGKAPYITPDEIEMLVREGVRQGEFDKFEAKVIQELFDFTETDVHKVMTPRDRVHFLPREASLSAAAELASKEGRTRILVVDGDFDHVLGCVHVRDLLRFTDLQLDRTPVTVALRAVLFAPADLPADRLLVRMQKEHKLLAIIQDAEGRNVGICTVEDLLEELVGEIHDEFDAARAGHGHVAAKPPGTT